MCASAVEANKCSEFRRGLVNVPMADKELGGCVVCGVRLWVVRGDNVLRGENQGEGGGERGQRVPIEAMGHRNRSTCHFHSS